MEKNIKIGIIGLARSGTSCLNKLFNNFSNLNINNNYEIFNENNPYYKKNLLKKICTYYKINESQINEIISFLIKNDPEKYFNNYMNDIISENIKIFKILEHQLTLENQFKIINNTDFIFILKRNLLDTFISDRKAKIINKYMNVDTSDISININLNEYNLFVKKKEEWFNKIINYLNSNNKKYIIIEYEQFYDLNINQKMDYLKKILKDNINIDLNLNETLVEELQKQDNNNNYKQKITNYEEVKNILNI
jgi:hypothetical protein